MSARTSMGLPPWAPLKLYWSAHDNNTSIEVWQSATEETLHFNVAPELALEAFYHPFAHLRYEEHAIERAVLNG